jgi:hypothetical protein
MVARMTLSNKTPPGAFSATLPCKQGRDSQPPVMPVVKGFAGHGRGGAIAISGSHRAGRSWAIPHHNDDSDLVGFRGTRSCVSLGLRRRKTGAVDARIFALQSIASQSREAVRGAAILPNEAPCLRRQNLMEAAKAKASSRRGIRRTVCALGPHIICDDADHRRQEPNAKKA